MPARLALDLTDHEVSTVAREGWAGAKNGALLSLAESARWDVLLTVDGSMACQNRMDGRTIALIAVRSTSNAYRDLLPLMSQVLGALKQLTPGVVIRVPQ